MVSRWRRHLDLLQVIGMEPSFNNHPDEHSSVKMRDRPLHKDEIQRVCKILGLDTDGTVPDLRDRVRDEYFDDYNYGTWRNPKESKQGTSQFSTDELFRLIGVIKSVLRLDAAEVDIWDDLPDWGGELHIVTEDGEYDVEVVEKGRASWKDSWGDTQRYDSYECYKLAGRYFEDGRRHRLMVLRGLDTDECKYRSSVVLERQVDYGPYQRWKKQTYVQEVTVQ